MKNRVASPYTRLAGPGRAQVRTVYQQALQRLHRRGHPPRLPRQTPQEYLASVSWKEGEHLEAFQQLSHWASAAAYDPTPLPDDLPQRARELLELLTE